MRHDEFQIGDTFWCGGHKWQCTDTLTLKAESGHRIEFDPARLRGVQAYTTETRTIAVGDRLQWREPDNKRRIANGEYATVLKLDANNIEVKLDKGCTLSMALDAARKVDLGYTSTSHAAQGATVDRVIVNVDSLRSAQLVNRRQFYVSISRPGPTPAFTPMTPKRCAARSAGRRRRNWRSTSLSNARAPRPALVCGFEYGAPRSSASTPRSQSHVLYWLRTRSPLHSPRIGILSTSTQISTERR
jgi:hypothetical protein